jgi:hypothetical protein
VTGATASGVSGRKPSMTNRISAPFFPGCKLGINLPPKDFKFAEGEPFCVWTYTRGAENHAAAAAAPDPRGERDEEDTDHAGVVSHLT